MEYNPGTGFLTDDSGLVLRYHRRADLRHVGRILFNSFFGHLTSFLTSHKVVLRHVGRLLVTSLDQLPQSDASSTLCTSSCLSSQVSDIFSFPFQRDSLYVTKFNELAASGVFG